MAPNQARKITIVGAAGGMGSKVVSSLLDTGIHTVTAITRPDSQSPFPQGVEVIRAAYDDIPTLTNALKGQDVLIILLAFQAEEFQTPLIEAAAAAGVKYVLPCEFGSDPDHPKILSETVHASAKVKYRTLIEELGVSSWIGVITNPWLDMLFPMGVLGVNVQERKANFFDDGNVKVSFTTREKVGVVVAALLSQPEEKLATHKNKFVYVSDVLAGQRDLFQAALKATGTREEDWTVESINTAQAFNDSKARFAKSFEMQDGLGMLLGATFTEGWGGNFDHKVINEELGIGRDDVDKIIGGIVKQMLTSA